MKWIKPDIQSLQLTNEGAFFEKGFVFKGGWVGGWGVIYCRWLISLTTALKKGEMLDEQKQAHNMYRNDHSSKALARTLVICRSAPNHSFYYKYYTFSQGSMSII